MKTKMLILAALIGAAAMSADAGVRFGFFFGLPAPVVVSSPVVYTAPVAPAPVTVVQTVPPCPGVGYVWVAGYWSYVPTGRVWVPGAWQYRPGRVAYVTGWHGADGHHYGYAPRYDGHDRDGHRR